MLVKNLDFCLIKKKLLGWSTFFIKKLICAKYQNIMSLPLTDFLLHSTVGGRYTIETICFLYSSCSECIFTVV
jgi:hypothetical protein